MSSNAENELYSIKRELESVVSELEEVSAGLKKDFSGIGEEKYAYVINEVIDNYRSVQRKLENISTIMAAQSYAAVKGANVGLIV